MSNSAKSLREQLEEAFDEEQEEAGGSVDEDTEEPLGATEVEESEGGEEGDGSVESSDGDADPAPARAKEGGKKGAVPKEDDGANDSAAAVTVKAPASWKPNAREFWGKLPKEVQLEVQRREKHIENTLRETAEARKFADEFNRTIHPFEPLIASQNSDPITAVKNLMTTAAGLTIGTPVQKAAIVTDIIRQYGVDIGTLDDMLSGQAPQNAPPPQIQQYLQQQLAPVQQFVSQLQQQKQQYEQQQNQTLESEIDQFASTAEFFEDVRESMADLMEMAARRGQRMTLEQAYHKACALDDTINNVISQRGNAGAAQNRRQQMAQKRRAASSVSGAPKGSGGGAAAASLRSAIEEAWDESSGR